MQRRILEREQTTALTPDSPTDTIVSAAGRLFIILDTSVRARIDHVLLRDDVPSPGYWKSDVERDQRYCGDGERRVEREVAKNRRSLETSRSVEVSFANETRANWLNASFDPWTSTTIKVFSVRFLYFACT